MSDPNDRPAPPLIELEALLTEMERRAEERVSALTRDLDDIIERSSEAARDDEHDPEGATIGFERAQVTSLLGAARTTLVEIARARERLATGVVPACGRCGVSIPADRLLARPTTQHCVRCADG